VNVREEFPEYLATHQSDPDLMEADEELASAYLRAATVKSFAKFSPGLMPAFASIRLFGGQFERSVFDAKAAEVFLRVQREVSAAAGSDQVALGVRALAPGSVVLELEPIAPEGDGELGAAPAEAALVRVLDLHEAVEAGRDADALAYTGGDLAARLRQLVDMLDKLDAGVEIDLSGSDGRRRRVALTQVGRDHARRLFERAPHPELGMIHGVLASVSLGIRDARIELRHGRHKDTIVEVPLDVAKRIEWDLLMRVRVRTLTRADGGKPVHQYIGIVQHDEVVPDIEEPAADK
jgi:hypothetical protein